MSVLNTFRDDLEEWVVVGTVIAAVLWLGWMGTILQMGWRVRIKVGKRMLFSHSYPSKEKALRAEKKTRGAKGIVKSQMADKKLSREEIRRILGPFASMGSAKSITALDMERNLNLAKGRLAKLKEKLRR